jgi:hypothetical protein
MKIQAAIITVAIAIMVIESVTTFSTFSFAARTNNSTGTQHPTTGTTGTTGTVDVSLKSQKALPPAGIPVIVTYTGPAGSGQQPIPSHFNANEHITAVQIPSGHYDVSVSFSYPQPDVHPKYIGDCRGTINAGDHLNCIIDPYGHVVSTTSQSTTTSTAKRVPSQTTTATNPVAHNATTTLMGGGNSPGSYSCSNTDNFLWNHVYGASGYGKEQWNRPNQQHLSTPSRLIEQNPSCITVTGTVYSAHPGGTADDEDGDLKITLTLDKQYEKYSKNGTPCIPQPCKNIHVEVICHNPSLANQNGYFTKWGDYCNGVNHVFYKIGDFPNKGDKLSVSGKFVFDNGMEQWNEIHPASNIHKIQ